MLGMAAILGQPLGGISSKYSARLLAVQLFQDG
jgi:hypothetical protein